MKIRKVGTYGNPMLAGTHNKALFLQNSLREDLNKRMWDLIGSDSEIFSSPHHFKYIHPYSGILGIK